MIAFLSAGGAAFVRRALAKALLFRISAATPKHN
jgi:hypothetical protein